MKKLIEKLLVKLLAKPLQKLARHIEKWNAEADAARAAEEAIWEGPSPEVPSSKADNPHDAVYAGAGDETPTAKPWKDCRYASCWDGDNAKKRFMNMLSPKFSDSKFGEYLSWTIAKGCDHLHLILLNEGDGEGAGYDCCTDSKANATALERIRQIRAKGLGIILWVVTDDSPNYRAKLFANPSKYAKGAANLLPYASAIVIGLEMDEGGVSSDQWKGVRSAFKSFADVPFGVHHTSGNEFKFASLGDFICGQLDPSASTADVKKQIAAIKAKGKEAVGFEYDRKPNRAKAQAALDAGAHAVGNWAGGSLPGQVEVPSPSSSGETPTPNSNSTSADAVDFSLLDWRWGGFNGSKASLSSARIRGLKVSSGSLSYSWERGSCSDLDAACTHDKPCCTCALFCRVDGKWVGGKFEHISTDRTSRGLGNVQEGYGGWDPAALTRADAYAFVILDDGAKRRTNVITCAR